MKEIKGRVSWINDKLITIIRVMMVMKAHMLYKTTHHCPRRLNLGNERGGLSHRVRLFSRTRLKSEAHKSHHIKRKWDCIEGYELKLLGSVSFAGQETSQLLDMLLLRKICSYRNGIKKLIEHTKLPSWHLTMAARIG